MLELDRLIFDRAYNAVANRTLWFIAHLLFDTAHAPTFGRSLGLGLDGVSALLRELCAALAEEAAPGGKVMVQDYHLILVRGCCALAPDLRISHFTHTPWAVRTTSGCCPDDVAVAVLEDMLGADRLGFHCERWATRSCAAATACWSRVTGNEVRYRGSLRPWRCIHLVSMDRAAQTLFEYRRRDRMELLPSRSMGGRCFCASTAPNFPRTSFAA